MRTLTPPWTAPPVWTVPQDWPSARCFVICGGESIKEQVQQIAEIRRPMPGDPKWTHGTGGRIIAVKHGVLLRPDADVLFCAGERPADIMPPLLKAFRGADIVVRGRGHHVFPPESKRVLRTDRHERWSTDPTRVAGFDAGTSAINLAILRGAQEIILIGYDMTGGRWFTGPHYLPQPPESDFQRHMSPLPALAAHAQELGIRIVNCSPISRVTCFERQPLETFL